MRSKLPESESLPNHLLGLVEVLGVRKEALLQLHSLGYALDIFVGIFDETGNITVKLENQVLLAIYMLGIDLILDVYAQ